MHIHKLIVVIGITNFQIKEIQKIEPKRRSSKKDKEAIVKNTNPQNLACDLHEY